MAGDEQQRAYYLLGYGDGRHSVTRHTHGRKLFAFGLALGLLLGAAGAALVVARALPAPAGDVSK